MKPFEENNEKLVQRTFDDRFNSFARGATKKPVGGANAAVTREGIS